MKLLQAHPVLQCSFFQQQPETMAHIQALAIVVDVTRLYDDGQWELLWQTYATSIAGIKPYLTAELFTLVENYLLDVVDRIVPK